MFIYLLLVDDVKIIILLIYFYYSVISFDERNFNLPDGYVRIWKKLVKKKLNPKPYIISENI